MFLRCARGLCVRRSEYVGKVMPVRNYGEGGGVISMSVREKGVITQFVKQEKKKNCYSGISKVKQN